MPTAQTAGHQLSPIELGAWRGFLRVHAALVKSLDAELASAHDLPLSSYEVLLTLEAAPGHKRRMSELADSVLLSRSGMTRLVDRLERDGLLERDHCRTPRARRISTACGSASSRSSATTS
jgi:DNA-binding MarR family transcriptional regulator